MYSYSKMPCVPSYTMDFNTHYIPHHTYSYEWQYIIGHSNHQRNKKNYLQKAYRYEEKEKPIIQSTLEQRTTYKKYIYNTSIFKTISINVLSADTFNEVNHIIRFFFPFSSINFSTRGLDGRKILDSAFCAMLSNPPGLWEVSSLVFFAIPMVVMIILYGRMGLQIRFRSKHTSVLGKLIELLHTVFLYMCRRHIMNNINQTFYAMMCFQIEISSNIASIER